MLVNTTNPVEYFACCGLLELATAVHGPRVESYFRNNEFIIELDSNCLNATELLRHLCNCTFDSFGNDVIIRQPLDAGPELCLDWWTGIHVDGESEPRPSPFKCWAGTIGKTIPGIRDKSAKEARDILYVTHSKSTSPPLIAAAKSLFACSDINDQWLLRCVEKAQCFGANPLYVPFSTEFGFSLDKQGIKREIEVFTELLFALGLQRFRPLINASGEYTYATWSIPLTSKTAIAASHCGNGSIFRFHLAKITQYVKRFQFAHYVEPINVRLFA